MNILIFLVNYDFFENGMKINYDNIERFTTILIKKLVMKK